MHYAGCCHPLPGDPIVGIVTTGKGVTIHTADCPTLQSFAATPERFIDVAWEGGPGHGEAHVGRISIATANDPGALAAITNVIGKHDGAIASLKIQNRTTDFFDMLVDVEVRDISHLADIIAALRACNGVATVERARA